MKKKENKKLVKLAFSLRGGETLQAVVPMWNYSDIMKTLNNGGTSALQILGINTDLGTTYITRNNLLYVQVWFDV